MDRIVFLDRDGTLCSLINGKRGPRNISELSISREIIDGCWQLRVWDFKLVMVTNQPDIARGLLSWEDLIEVNNTIKRYCGIDHVEVCPHDDKDDCSCRKPLPGMLLLHNYDPNHSYMIGDTWKDYLAATKAGISSLILGSDHGIKYVSEVDSKRNHLVNLTFNSAVNYIGYMEGKNNGNLL